MSVTIDLPPQVEASLLAEVEAGLYPSVEKAILGRLTHPMDLRPAPPPGMSHKQFEEHLEQLWDDRSNKVSSTEMLARMEKMKEAWIAANER